MKQKIMKIVIKKDDRMNRQEREQKNEVQSFNNNQPTLFYNQWLFFILFLEQQVSVILECGTKN